MTDSFSDASREVAAQYYPGFGRELEDAYSYDGFVVGSEWARGYIARQEPAEDEIEAAARAIFNAQNRNVAEWDTYDGEFWIKRMYREDARAALTAARDRAAPDQPLP